MQLIYAAASPFARKVRVLAAETGLLDRIELLDTAVLPTTLNERVNALNPLGKIPVLLTDDDQVLYDSRVICEYLDTLHAGAKLLPSGAARWQVLRLAALADGLMDAALLARYERGVRPAELQWAAWLDGQLGKVQRSLAELERQVERLQGPLDLGQIGVACALGYLDFRFADLDWRAAHPGLAAFQQTFAQRASMLASAPV
ncbi:Glutathione S-transferase [Pseudomonas sp. NFACC19-2]|uniref:Glutathione S-transferase n=1 Tax=Ectopseudomonas toyotomiensis TaxID=554344 RepID=A0A1I5T9A9_9GAMM|nr:MULTISPECIES: glutathione S-transferase [Pseudomonas]PIA74032.1 glutathione S-transferase [Pseudomonas toyotomiensis]QSL94923.1 glutathione S-transferase [Pseudomonas toyotomiensis]SDA46803.1 Glutathione S-transferase [Pseudomonas sp. NFPP33]SFP79237.1 Glutathione S-transferase [Pseudomonas toyotomiensis]SFW25818.1 Glutathione S-transferase [Pseudomonas sp. NFACC19-2]